MRKSKEHAPPLDGKREETADQSKVSASPAESNSDAMYQILLSQGLLETAAPAFSQPANNIAGRNAFAGNYPQALPFASAQQPQQQQQLHLQTPMNSQPLLPQQHPRFIPPLSTAPTTTGTHFNQLPIQQLLLLQRQQQHQQQQHQQVNIPLLAMNNSQSIIHQQQEQILRQQLLQQQTAAASLSTILHQQTQPTISSAFAPTLLPANTHLRSILATNPPSQTTSSISHLGANNPSNETAGAMMGQLKDDSSQQPSSLVTTAVGPTSGAQASAGVTQAASIVEPSSHFARAQEPTQNSGTSPSLSDLPQIRIRVRGQMDEAIRSIPTAEKAAYLEALQRASAVVQRESDQLQFLRRCNYDLWAACKRLCAYWTERLKAFGKERFCKPLTLTGDGALDEHDISQLHAGWPSILPTKTNEGKQALFFDRRKYIPDANGENRVRCVFYIFYILASQDTEATDFTAFSLVTHTGRFHAVDFGWVISIFKIVIKCMPLQVHWHLLNIPNPYKQHQYQNLMKWAADNVIKLFGGGEVHIEFEKGQLLKFMHSDMGMPKKAIPVVVGGEWRFEEFYEWCKKRSKVEREECKELLSASVDQSVQDSSLGTAKDESGKPSAPLTAEERKRKRRLADLIQSRRKRERQRLELESLKTESSHLIHEHARLKVENKQLTKAVEEATQILRDRGLGQGQDIKMGAS